MTTLKNFLPLCFLAFSGVAQSKDTKNQAIHPWVAAEAIAQSQAYIIDLKDGDKIQTPILIRFGLSGGWGLAPIDNKGSAKSGHHHLLVNLDLPLDFKKPLPFNEQYIHFGKGQMETVLNLKPGSYTLRMLLADEKHLPHFVYSKPVRIAVTQQNTVDPKTLVKQGVSLDFDEKQPLTRPFTLRMHASGYRIGQQGQGIAETSHFKLKITPKTGAPLELTFLNGQTEVRLQPPDGEYTASLLLIDNKQSGKVVAQSEPVQFVVKN